METDDFRAGVARFTSRSTERARVRAVDYSGEYYRSRGPLNVLPSPAVHFGSRAGRIIRSGAQFRRQARGADPWPRRRRRRVRRSCVVVGMASPRTGVSGGCVARRTGDPKHRFTPALPRQGTPDGFCVECSTGLEPWEGQAGGRKYRLSAREVGEALVSVAPGRAIAVRRRSHASARVGSHRRIGAARSVRPPAKGSWSQTGSMSAASSCAPASCPTGGECHKGLCKA
jgi:hypothetical protein